ncbi:MAG: transketolase, partial [Planctomycetaceae bacterium]
MHQSFASQLTRLAKTDSRLVLLSGEPQSRDFESFRKQFPERYFDCGAADSRLVAQATGMALSGLRPVVYATIPAVTTGCLESIRNSICRWKARVVLVGADESAGSGTAADSHTCRHDLAVMRFLPHLAVACPADDAELHAVLRAALN